MFSFVKCTRISAPPCLQSRSRVLLPTKVLWDDTVSSDPVSSARQFINVFFVDPDVNVTDAVVAVRLPYNRVNITGTDSFTFASNDVVRSFFG